LSIFTTNAAETNARGEEGPSYTKLVSEAVNGKEVKTDKKKRFREETDDSPHPSGNGLKSTGEEPQKASKVKKQRPIDIYKKKKKNSGSRDSA
jgi:hypothetical protein